MAVLDKFRKKATEKMEANRMGQEVDEMMRYASDSRRSFERRWYNNDFFDDGFHFRYVSRETGRIVDLTRIHNSGAPKRNIPKTSRQIRGVANLLLAPDYTPVVYPESLSFAQFLKDGVDPQQAVEMFDQAKEVAKNVALKQGHWLRQEWEVQETREKLMHMVILAAKHGISYLQIYPDSVKEEIVTGVFDAFDIYVVGDVTDIYDAAAIIKAHPRSIKEIKADESFQEADTSRLSPDNRLASSEVKEAYKRSKIGRLSGDSNPTVIQKEAYIKEYLNDSNWELVNKKFPKVMEGKEKGDVVMRHVFTAGGVTLLDEYVALDEYPFVDFRFEPGELYQTPFIERFMGANKSLDIIVHRIEQWANTMAAGSWSIRSGEDFKITNKAGGAVYEYDVAPPIQNQIAPLPNTLFSLAGMLESFIEEQGASTSALGKLPSGVKSGVAIESLKATEYDNLTIAVRMLKQTIKRISERELDYAADYFLNTQNIILLDEGEPTYFDMVGARGAKLSKELGDPVSLDTIIMRKGTKVKIEVESGLGFTTQGKKETVQQIIDYMIQLAELNLIPMEAVKIVTGQFLRIFQFGGTQEFMDSMDQFIEKNNGEVPEDGQMTPEDEKQIEMIKVGVLEALDQAGEIGDKGREQMIEATKIAFLEVMEQLQGGQPQQ